MLLCTVADKYKPIGRNMWESVATEYNQRRSRNWLARDFDSLRRKFRSLYSKSKPTGINGEIPPKLRPISLAQEVQRAIELKGGAHTSHDGFDRGQDDAHLLREVEEAVDAASASGNRDEAVVEDDEDAAPRDSASEDSEDEEEDSQAQLDDLSQYGQADPDESQVTPGLNVGTVQTRQGNFDASLGDEVYSDDEEDTQFEDSETTALTGSGTRNEQPATATEATPRPPNIEAGDGDVGRANSPTLAATDSPTSTAAVVTPIATSGETLRGSQRSPKPADRPKGARRASTTACPTFASPRGPALSRDPSRAVVDSQEMQLHTKKNTVSNRLGGGDLRVLRDNLGEMNTRSTGSGSKRDSTESSASGATYVSNKRARARKRLDQLQKEMDEGEAKHSTAGGDMMQILVFMREDGDHRAEVEDRRRREDREARLAAERQEREERENLRREEAAAAESRRIQEMEMTRVLREEQNKKDAAAAAENRLRYEERQERDRAEARERHEQMLLLIAAMQRGTQPPQ
jgi:hypothetical protein